ncbi:MAG: hypothetical protein OXF66_00770 [Gammaproteobacteria bacterium]|nr:hypothetical protein [Gammaproteobacteria bacterium]
MKRLACLLIGAAALFIAAAAETEEVISLDLERFELWNDCAPMDLIIEDLPDAAIEIGLKKEAIETTVRSRLRAARLFDAGKSQYLYVNVTMTELAFNISFEYKKVLYDPASERHGFAITWGWNGTGTHGSDSGFILSAVSQYTDKFIDEYLRVNEDACSRSP